MAGNNINNIAEMLGEKDILNAIPEVRKPIGRRAVRNRASMKVTPKQLKDMVKEGLATDITNAPDIDELDRKLHFEVVSVGKGIYGMNCALLKGNDGKTYVITSRNSNLFKLV